MDQKEKITIYFENTRALLTLSSASLPVIVTMLGLLVHTDPSGKLLVPPYLKANATYVAWALGSFLAAIFFGMLFNYLLTFAIETAGKYQKERIVVSLLMHLAFVAGAVSFAIFAWRILGALSQG